jgi:hypothetical protein
MIAALEPYAAVIWINLIICILTLTFSVIYIVKAIRMPSEAREMRGTPFMRFMWIANKCWFVVVSLAYGILEAGDLLGMRWPMDIQFISQTLILACLLSAIATSLARLIYDHSRKNLVMSTRKNLLLLLDEGEKSGGVQCRNIIVKVLSMME